MEAGRAGRQERTWRYSGVRWVLEEYQKRRSGGSAVQAMAAPRARLAAALLPAISVRRDVGEENQPVVSPVEIISVLPPTSLFRSLSQNERFSVFLQFCARSSAGPITRPLSRFFRLPMSPPPQRCIDLHRRFRAAQPHFFGATKPPAQGLDAAQANRFGSRCISGLNPCGNDTRLKNRRLMFRDRNESKNRVDALSCREAAIVNLQKLDV
jgi:hypothetical protein